MTDLIVIPKAIMKKEFPDVAQNIWETLEADHGSLGAFVLLKRALEICKVAIESHIDDAMLHFEGKQMAVFGAKVTTRALREYEYDDPTLIEMEKNLDTIKTLIKERKEFLQTLKEELVVPKTGEVVKPATLKRDGVTLSVSFTEAKNG